jgi:hypothetical protein
MNSATHDNGKLITASVAETVNHMSSHRRAWKRIRKTKKREEKTIYRKEKYMVMR